MMFQLLINFHVRYVYNILYFVVAIISNSNNLTLILEIGFDKVINLFNNILRKSEKILVRDFIPFALG